MLSLRKLKKDVEFIFVDSENTKKNENMYLTISKLVDNIESNQLNLNQIDELYLKLGENNLLILIKKVSYARQIQILKLLLEAEKLDSSELNLALNENHAILLMETLQIVLLLHLYKKYNESSLVQKSDRILLQLVDFYTAWDIVQYKWSRQLEPYFQPPRLDHLLLISQLCVSLIEASNKHQFGKIMFESHDLQSLDIKNYLSFLKFCLNIDIKIHSKSYCKLNRLILTCMVAQNLKELKLNFKNLLMFLTYNKEKISQLDQCQAQNLLSAVVATFDRFRRLKNKKIVSDSGQCIMLIFRQISRKLKIFPNYLIKRALLVELTVELAEEALKVWPKETIFKILCDHFLECFLPIENFAKFEPLFKDQLFLIEMMLPTKISNLMTSLLNKKTLQYEEALILIGNKKLFQKFESQIICDTSTLLVALFSQNIDNVRFVVSKAKEQDIIMIEKLFKETNLSNIILTNFRVSFFRLIKRVKIIGKLVSCNLTEIFSTYAPKFLVDDILLICNEKASNSQEKYLAELAEALNDTNVYNLFEHSYVYQFLNFLPNIDEIIGFEVLQEKWKYTKECVKCCVTEKIGENYLKKERANFELSFPYQDFIRNELKEYVQSTVSTEQKQPLFIPSGQCKGKKGQQWI